MDHESWYGFDLGHGETAVSLSGTSSRVETRNLQIARGGAKVVPTVVATGPDGSTLIGDSALLHPKATDVRAAFKHPDVARQDVREPVIRFVRGLLAEMAACGTRMDGKLVFGHPSGWTPTQVEGYRSLLAEASGQYPLMVPEARAAFLPLKHTGELSSHEIEHGRIVIVDMGSSTTDFALVRGVDDPLDLGNPGGVQLGAGLIELALFRLCSGSDALDSASRERLHAFLGAHVSERVHVVVEFRKAKEKFFTSEPQYRASGGGALVDLEIVEMQLGIRWAPRITAELMDRALNESLHSLGVREDLFGRPVSIKRSWRQELYAHVDFALERFQEPPTTIVLTGGAAKMSWVYEEIKNRYPGATVIRTAEPEHTIANGLALQGTVLARSTSIRAAIDEFVRSDEVEQLIAHAWDSGAERLVDPLVSGFVDRFVVPAVLQWRRGKMQTLNEIGEYGGRLAAAWADSPEGRQQLAAAAADWYHECVAPTVNARVREIGARYPDIPLHAIELPEQALSVNVAAGGAAGELAAPDLVLADIDKALNGVIVVVSSVVAMSLFGAGHAALLATGPGAVVAAAGVAIVALFAGKEAAMTWVKGANLPPLARKAVPEGLLTNQIGRKREEIEREVRAGMVKTLTENAEARTQLARSVSALIDETLAKRVRAASAYLV